MFFTYIIIPETSGKLYIGQTNNLEERLKRHNSNKSLSTKNKGPWKLLFYKEFSTRNESVQFEKKLKSYKNKQYILDKINTGNL